MIRSLRGTIVDSGHTDVVLEVGGVGYRIFTSSSGTQFPLGSTQHFFTYLAVREHALDLYGFTTRDELAVFEKLLTLPKIGPKSSLQILAQADLSLLREAVLQQDAAHLSKLSGIGKKTAETVVLGLKDYFDSWDSATGTHTPGATFQAETVDALVALGYPQKDARDAVQKLPPDITTTNEALKAALHALTRI
jgi:Holliday junction DNA helicase RuvA